MINLEDVFPTVLATTRSRGAKLDLKDKQTIEDLAIRVELVNEIKLIRSIEENPAIEDKDKRKERKVLEDLKKRLELQLAYNLMDKQVIVYLINHVTQLKSQNKPDLKIDINGVVTWEECIDALLPIKKKYDRPGVNSEGVPMSSLALPVMLTQIILYISYTFSEISQSKMLKRFKDEKYGTMLNKKIFNNVSTVQDYRDVVGYNQPPMHIKYQGQKRGSLAEAIKNLVFQAGEHKYFVDIFGGSGAGTLAVPRRNKTKYVYNDLDKGMYSLYKVVSNKQLSKVLIGYLQDLSNDLKFVDSDDEIVQERDWIDSIDFEYEVRMFYEGRTYKDTATNILEYSTYEDFELKYVNNDTDNTLYEYLKYFYSCLCELKTKEAETFKDMFSEDGHGGVDASKFIFNYITRGFNYADLVSFSEANGIDLLEAYANKDDGTSIFVANFAKSAEQYRYFQWYAYFSNCVKIANEDSRDVSMWGSDDIPVLLALAEVYLWSFLFNDSTSPDAIYKINHANGTIGKGHLKFVNNLPTRIEHIEAITNILADGKTIEENDCYNKIINKYTVRGKDAYKTLYYSDSPYISTAGYGVGEWGTGDSVDLINALIGSKQKFIFSCRACARTVDEVKAVDTNTQIYFGVLKYFESVVDVVNKKLGRKKTGRMSLWVTYINLDKLPLEDAIAQHKRTEIMITNYEVQSFGSPDTFSVMTYEEFMTIVDKHLKRNVTESDSSIN